MQKVQNNWRAEARRGKTRFSRTRVKQRARCLGKMLQYQEMTGTNADPFSFFALVIFKEHELQTGEGQNSDKRKLTFKVSGMENGQ